MVQQNRLSHALLFSAKEGRGALPLAIAFAQYLVCDRNTPKNSQEAPSLFEEQQPAKSIQQPAADSCGTCPACMKAAKLIHPDIHFSFPTVTKKQGEKPIAADFIQEWREFIRLHSYGNLFDWIETIKEKENSQGKITAEECNDIIRKLSLKSFESGYKILILWMPEELEKEGNKLLKIIEEPPANTLFILVTENEDLVLPTIISRCQIIKIPELETKDIEESLISRNRTEPTIAKQVSVVCEGNYREALLLAQHAEEDWLSLLRDWLNATLKSGPVAQTKWVEEISRLGREKQKQFLRYFNHLLQQAVYLNITGETPGAYGAEKELAGRMNRFTGIEQQQAIMEELDKASYYIERNANSKILFHALTIKLYHIIQDRVLFVA